MILNNPVKIGSRLIPTVTLDDASIGITYAEQPGDDSRTRYQWYIDIGKQEYTGDDIQSGCQGGSLQEGLESLLSFLCAAGESWKYRENHWNDGEPLLFADPVCAWASEHQDELSMLGMELEETSNLIDER